MNELSLQINTFKDYFDGNRLNYGQHGYSFNEEGVKEAGSNKTITNKLITISQYQDHLEGKVGLGIIPINEDNKCKFTVIDVDIYSQTFEPYIKAIAHHNIPLVPFRSKSGGLHLYLFFKQATKAKQAVDVTAKLARMLGITLLVKQKNNSTLEIFPKQTKLVNERVGSWINLPYFNAENTKQGLIKDGKLLGINEAMTYIKSQQTTLEDLTSLMEDLPFNDAPPCIQTLNILNMLDISGGRNNFLFSCGVYLKKKDENFFEQKLMEINERLPDPLDVREVEDTVISSLRRKSYTYKCTEAPCVDFCDKSICKLRKYGIGKEGGLFTNISFGNLVQYNCHEPYYEWDVKAQDSSTSDDFKRLRFRNEDEIIRQDAFLKLCFRELHFLPYKMKQTEWFKIVNQALSTIKIVTVEEEDDTSLLTMFHRTFYDFLLRRAMAKTRSQILAKRVYYDYENERYLFRMKDFLEYMYDNKNFTKFTPSEVHALLRDVGIRFMAVRTEDKKKQVRCALLPKSKVPAEYIVEAEEEFEVDFSESFEDEKF